MKRKILFGITALLVLADLFFLNWKIVKKEPVVVQQALSTPQPMIINSSCPNSCLFAIYEATSSIKLASPVVTPTPTPIPVLPPSLVKEFYIPLGSGVSKNGDWENIATALGYIDSSKYGKIKTVVLEVIAHIPNGNQGASIRLYNSTDKHPVWYSELYLEGGTTQLLTSQPLALGSGNKLYQLQAKTTLKYDVLIDISRIKITTE